jgi:hypothetical protein
MRYTTLLKTGRGIRLRDLHLARLVPEGDWVRAAFEAFEAAAAPGAWGLRAVDGRLEILPRAGSALADGMPTRLAVSPVAHLRGPLEKPPSPCPWDAVRVPGVATLLTDPAGAEIYESCRAAVLAWDGAAWVAPPADRPRVRSLALEAVRAVLPVREAPLPVASSGPLVLLNAVAGVVLPAIPGRGAPPQEALAALRAALEDGAPAIPAGARPAP